jgi:hypothetical protein
MTRTSGDVAQRWPDFFILGAPRCGTTFLYGALRAQDGVFMPSRKEPKFFAADLDIGGPRVAALRVRDVAKYLELFHPARPDQLVGEASPNYLSSTVAVRYILDANPSARFVVSLRDPVDQIASYHGLLRVANVEPLDLESALLAEDERTGSPSSTRVPWLGGLPRYREIARFGEQLQRLFRHASFEQVLVLTLDDIAADPLGTVTRITRFLGLPDPVQIGEPDRNASMAPRSRRLLEAVWSPAVKETVKSLVPHRLHKVAGRAALRAETLNRHPAQRPMVSQLMTDQLRLELRPDLELASRLVGQDLVTRWWGA